VPGVIPLRAPALPGTGASGSILRLSLVAQRAHPLALALPAIAVFFLHSLTMSSTFIDDSYIFYRYAEHWADGHGPVYNIGEYVEGYSSLLWTGLLTLSINLNLSPERVGPLWGVLSAILSLILLAEFAKRLLPQYPFAWVLIPLSSAISTGFSFYPLTGMDTALFSLVLLTAVFGAVEATKDSKNVPACAFALAALALVRAEGFIYALAIVGVLGLLVATKRVPFSWGRYPQLTLPLAVTVAGMLAFRIHYYGEWAPATVTAKGWLIPAIEAALTSSLKDVSPLVNGMKHGIKYESFIVLVALVPMAILLVRSTRRSGHAQHWLAPSRPNHCQPYVRYRSLRRLDATSSSARAGMAASYVAHRVDGSPIATRSQASRWASCARRPCKLHSATRSLRIRSADRLTTALPFDFTAGDWA
jgi:hypothetical protein